MRERRHRPSERLEQQHVLRRVRDVIVAADDVRDLHVDVVHDDREVVGRLAVRAQDDEVLDVRRCRTRSARAPDRRTSVCPSGTWKRIARGAPAASSSAICPARQRPARRGRTSSRRPPLRPPAASPAAPRASSSSSTRCLRRRAAAPSRGSDRAAATGSTARAARRCPALRPSRAPASAGLDDAGDHLPRRSLGVGVFDAQHERAAVPARVEPVEERSAGAADVQVTGGRGGEADAEHRWILAGIGDRGSGSGRGRGWSGFGTRVRDRGSGTRGRELTATVIAGSTVVAESHRRVH